MSKFQGQFVSPPVDGFTRRLLEGMAWGVIVASFVNIGLVPGARIGLEPWTVEIKTFMNARGMGAQHAWMLLGAVVALIFGVCGVAGGIRRARRATSTPPAIRVAGEIIFAGLISAAPVYLYLLLYAAWWAQRID